MTRTATLKNQVVTRLTDDEFEALAAIAHQETRTIGNLIRRVLVSYLDQQAV